MCVYVWRLVGPWTFARTPRMNSAGESIVEDKCDTFKYIYLKTERTMDTIWQTQWHRQLYRLVCLLCARVFSSDNGYRSPFTHTLSHNGDDQQFNFATHRRAGHCSLCAVATSQRRTIDTHTHTDQTMVNGIFEFFHVNWLTPRKYYYYFSLLRRRVSFGWWETTELISMHSNVLAKWWILIGCQTK